MELVTAKNKNVFSYTCPNCGYVKEREYKGLKINIGNIISLGQCTNCERTYSFLHESQEKTPIADAVRKIFTTVRELTKGKENV